MLSGSPFGLANLSGTTNGSGVAQFTNVPVGTGYTATATYAPYAPTPKTVNVAAPTTNTTIDLPVGILTVNTSWAGQAVGSANVSVTDGTNTFTGTTNASGVATFTVPTGTFNATVTKNGFQGTGSATVTTSGGSVTVSNFPTGTITVTATWATELAGSASVSITGGPNGGTYTGTTDADDRDRARDHRAGDECHLPVHGDRDEERRLGRRPASRRSPAAAPRRRPSP